MSLLMKSAVVLLAVSIPLSASYARTFSLSGKHSRAEIASKCDAAGGVKSNTSGKSGKYSCNNLDKGTSVDCNANGKCTGTVPQ